MIAVALICAAIFLNWGHIKDWSENIFGDPQADKAIELVKSGKMNFGETGNPFADLLLSKATVGNGTWEDFANQRAQEDPNAMYAWTATKKEETTYLVSFADKDNRGYRWEVSNLSTVVYVNTNEYLSRKYGLSRLDRGQNFKVQDMTIDTLKIEKEFGSFSGKLRKQGVVYELKGDLVNMSNRSITKAHVEGELKLIFKNKTVKADEISKSKLQRAVTEENPWRHGDTIGFYVKTDLDEMPLTFLEYIPEYAVFELGLEAEDPIGYDYDRVILEVNLRDQWRSLSLNHE